MTLTRFLDTAPSATFLGLLILGYAAFPARAAEKGKPADPLGANVLKLKDFGKAGAGGDDTAVFRRAFAEASRLKKAIQVPASRVPYRIAPLYLPSNTTVLLDAGVVLQALPGLNDGQKLLNIDDVSAVQILGYGASLKMNRAEYKSGQYRHCISVMGSTLVAIKGLTCEGAGGNGVYIGGSEAKQYSEEITLEDLKVQNTVGAGLRIVSAKNLAIRRSSFSQSHGYEQTKTKDPEQYKVPGIELLAGGPESRLERIQLEDTSTARNAGDGVHVVLSRLTAKSVPVSIVIVRHHDTDTGDSSFVGTNDPSSGRAVPGQLLLEDCTSQGAREYGALLSFWDSSGARASFRGLSVIDPNGSGSTMDNAAVAVKRGGGGQGRIGNVEFLRTTIRDTRPTPKLDYFFTIADYSHIGIENVIFRDAVQLVGARHQHPLGLYQGEGVEQIQRPDDPAIAALWKAAEKRDGGNRKIAGTK